MKEKLTLFLILFFISQITFSQNCNENFEGIIKYATSSENENIKDTIFAYFGKDKIRFERKGGLTDKYADLTDEYFDFTGDKNIGFYFSQTTGLNQVNYTTIRIDSLEILKDSIINMLDQPCFQVNQIYIPGYYLEATHLMEKTIFVSDELCYEIPEGWDFLESDIIANGSGKIGLKIKNKFHFHNPYNKTEKTTISYKVAFEIIPQKLEDSIFKIPN